MATKAHLEGNKRYLSTQEQVRFWVDKGQKDKIKAHAESKGMSMTEYIKKLIVADMNN